MCNPMLSMHTCQQSSTASLPDMITEDYPEMLRMLRSKWKLNREMTLALNTRIGSQFRAKIPPNSILVHTDYLGGFGDVCHLTNAEKLLRPEFKVSAIFALFMGIGEPSVNPSYWEYFKNSQVMDPEALEQMQIITRLEQNYLTVKDVKSRITEEYEATKMKLISRSSGATLIPYWIGQFDMQTHVPNFPRIKLVFSISTEIANTHPKGVPTDVARGELRCIEEVDTPLDTPPTTMGLGPAQAGIWLYQEPDYRRSLFSLTKSFAALLGCSQLQGDGLIEWYNETLICSCMVHSSSEVINSIFANLLILNVKGRRRLIFKTTKAPEVIDKNKKFNKNFLDALKRQNVQRFYYNEQNIFTTKQTGIELRVVDQRFENSDWESYKELINGTFTVGGDNTLSEALSNPNTLPPLIFPPHKQIKSVVRGYMNVSNLAYELPDDTLGKMALIEYFQATKELIDNEHPSIFESQLKKILDSHKLDEIQSAWRALVLYARQMDLHKYLVPLVTERALFAYCPRIADIRKKIFHDQGITDKEKPEAYAMQVESILKLGD